jgi:hypothetical protein
MGGALFTYRNSMDAAAVSAGSEANTMRSFNLADPIVMRGWRSLSASSYFLARFQAAADLDLLGLFGATLGEADQVRHRLYDAGGIVTLDETVDAGVIDGYGQHVHKLASTQTGVLTWRCDITATSRAGVGYFDIGRAWAGPAVEPSVGISEGWASGFVEETQMGRAKYSGLTFGAAGVRRRIMEFGFDYLDEDDKAALEDMARICGISAQVLFVPFYDADPARQAILGKFVNPQLIVESNNTAPPTYSQKFRIEQDV